MMLVGSDADADWESLGIHPTIGNYRVEAATNHGRDSTGFCRVHVRVSAYVRNPVCASVCTQRYFSVDFFSFFFLFFSRNVETHLFFLWECVLCFFLLSLRFLLLFSGARTTTRCRGGTTSPDDDDDDDTSTDESDENKLRFD